MSFVLSGTGGCLEIVEVLLMRLSIWMLIRMRMERDEGSEGGGASWGYLELGMESDRCWLVRAGGQRLRQRHVRRFLFQSLLRSHRHY
jgi:hypothetical protein